MTGSVQGTPGSAGDGIIQDQQHPNDSSHGDQSHHGGCHDQKLVETADGGSTDWRRSLDCGRRARLGRWGSRSRDAGPGCGRCNGCRRALCRWRRSSTRCARRTTRRQRRQFDGRRRRRLRRQIDADGFFFRLDLAGFFLRRWHSAGRGARNVLRDISHNRWFKIDG